MEQPKWVQVWIDALRSGEYIQARKRLRVLDSRTKKGYRYCCLGVLTDLCVNDKLPGIDPPLKIAPWKEYGTVEGGLPVSVARLLNLPDHACRVVVGDNIYHLASNNDKGSSFKDIAYLLENGKLVMSGSAKAVVSSNTRAPFHIPESKGE